MSVFEQVEHLARIGADRSGDEVRGRHVPYPGEPVYAAAGRLGDEADGAVLEDDDRGAVGTLVDQGQRIGDRGVRGQRDRGVHHEVAALDEVDGVLDRHQRKVLGQNDDSTRRATVSAIRLPATAVMLATTTGIVVPDPSTVDRSTSKRDATSEHPGTMKTSS